MPIKVQTTTGLKNIIDRKVSNGDGTYTNIKRTIEWHNDGNHKTLWRRNTTIQEAFRFTIDTQQRTNATNSVLTDAAYNITTILNRPYDWDISWGDGSREIATGDVSATIPHVYPAPGEYTITIRPNGNQYAWLNALRLGYTVSTINTQKVKKIISPWTVKMLLTESEIATGISEADTSNVTNALLYMFASYCNGYEFSLAEGSGFTPEWDDISEATLLTNGFRGSSLKYLPKGFTLPSNITAMPVFYSLSEIFNGCLQLEDIADFNLPQGLTRVGDYAFSQMFGNCNALCIPADAPFCFPPSGIWSVSSEFPSSFLTASLDSTPMGKTISAIINGRPTPSSRTGTFRTGGQDNDEAGRARWSDWDDIHVNWK